MNLCQKCGAPLGPADRICGKCGTPVTQAFVVDTKKINLIKDLETYRELLSETEELKSMIKPQSSFPSSVDRFKTRSFMRYFWPFMVGGPVAGYVIYIISTIIMMSSVMSMDTYNMTNEQAQRASASILSDTFGGMIVALFVTAAIIIFGVVISKRKQRDFNSNAEFMNMQASERYNMGVKNQKMIDIYQDDINRMYKYESLVPEEYRKPSKIRKIIDVIKDEKADTVEEAIALLEQDN